MPPKLPPGVLQLGQLHPKQKAEKALSGNKKRSWGMEVEGMQTPSLWKEINHQRGIQHKQRMTE